MKLLVISPAWEKFPHWEFHMSLLGPLTVAGLTPEGWEIEYRDENVGPISLEEDADLVAVSAMTAQAARGYEIVDAYRDRGVPVVMGGMHATLLPDEALAHADAVVIGEAEDVWPALLRDFEDGALRRRYARVTRADMSCHAGAFPRRDLLPAAGYTEGPAGGRAVDTIQAGRGCARGCEHCNVPEVLGVRYRPRPLAAVLEEIEGTGAHYLFFVDDCLPTEPGYFSRLFRELAGRGRRFLSVGALHLVNDPEYLSTLAEGGMRVFYLGFDRLDPSWRPELGRGAKDEAYRVDLKKHDVDFCRDYLNRPRVYIDAIGRLKDHGIAVIATFAFGFDDDDVSIFERSIEFALDAGVELADFAVLTPYPHSPLAARLEAEGRILTRDWGLYNGRHAVFRPGRMTPERLEEGTRWAWEAFDAERPFLVRMIETFGGESPRIAGRDSGE